MTWAEAMRAANYLATIKRRKYRVAAYRCGGTRRWRYYFWAVD